jgi:hypothetical protein
MLRSGSYLRRPESGRQGDLPGESFPELGIHDQSFDVFLMEELQVVQEQNLDANEQLDVLTIHVADVTKAMGNACMTMES